MPARRPGKAMRNRRRYDIGQPAATADYELTERQNECCTNRNNSHCTFGTTSVHRYSRAKDTGDLAPIPAK